MNTLDEIMLSLSCDKASLWHGHTLRYTPLFEPLRNEPIRLLEFGVQFGLSIRGWLKYFSQARIYGVDISNEHGINDPRFKFYHGNQADETLLLRIKQEVPGFEIIIDDASHRAADARMTFTAMWSALAPGGIYAIEDTCTYWDPRFASGVVGEEWFRELIRDLNWRGLSYHGRPGGSDHTPSPFEASLDSILFFKHLCILTKKR